MIIFRPSLSIFPLVTGVSYVEGGEMSELQPIDQSEDKSKPNSCFKNKRRVLLSNNTGSSLTVYCILIFNYRREKCSDAIYEPFFDSMVLYNFRTRFLKVLTSSIVNSE